MSKKKRKHKSRVICAWCGKDLGPSNTPEDSHGVCQSCKQKVFPPKR